MGAQDKGVEFQVCIEGIGRLAAQLGLSKAVLFAATGKGRHAAIIITAGEQAPIQVARLAADTEARRHILVEAFQRQVAFERPRGGARGDADDTAQGTRPP